MTRRKRFALVALVLLSSVGCDRVTKDYAEQSLIHAGRISMLRDTVRLEYVENRGAFLGLGAGLSEPARTVVLKLGSVVLVLVVLGWALFSSARTKWELVALALVASGGVGNLWDRFLRDGAVIDFMNLGIGSLRTGIFNVADVAIMAGAALLALQGLRARPPAVQA